MTKTDIIDAINLVLIGKWKDRTVYVDVCPVDFDRPSFWLTVERDEVTDAKHPTKILLFLKERKYQNEHQTVKAVE